MLSAAPKLRAKAKGGRLREVFELGLKVPDGDDDDGKGGGGGGAARASRSRARSGPKREATGAGSPRTPGMRV